MVVPPEPIRGRVDHLDALGAEVGQGGGDVGDGIADVVDALAPPGQEAAHRGVGGEGGDQLDEGVACAEQQLVHALVLDHLLVGDLKAQHLLVEGAGRGQVGDGDADMVEASKLHGGSFQGGPSQFGGVGGALAAPRWARSRIQSVAVWSRSQPAPAAPGRPTRRPR